MVSILVIYGLLIILKNFKKRYSLIKVVKKFMYNEFIEDVDKFIIINSNEI